MVADQTGRIGSLGNDVKLQYDIPSVLTDRHGRSLVLQIMKALGEPAPANPTVVVDQRPESVEPWPLARNYHVLAVILQGCDRAGSRVESDLETGPLYHHESGLPFRGVSKGTDRAILFSRLVRDLVGLDVVLLYYPGHLAAAVAFNDNVSGDYLTYKNKKYVVCDPTYINAGVGRTMPGMNNQEAQIIALK